MTIIYQKDYDEKYFEYLKKNFGKPPKVSKDSKICFLDIDGVLNSNQFIEENPDIPIGEIIDPVAVARVNAIIERTGAKIVVSSSWRIPYLDDPAGFENLKTLFAKHGIKNIVGMTPQLRGEHRSREIAAWLAENEVKSFVIIDDDSYAQLDNKLVKTMFHGANGGIQDDHVEEAIRILNEVE